MRPKDVLWDDGWTIGQRKTEAGSFDNKMIERNRDRQTKIETKRKKNRQSDRRT